jgi:hypothetical protein
VFVCADAKGAINVANAIRVIIVPRSFFVSIGRSSFFYFHGRPANIKAVCTLSVHLFFVGQLVWGLGFCCFMRFFCWSEVL